MTTHDTLKQKIINRLSASGVNLRVDDDPPDDMGGIIEDALTYIDEYCYHRYAAENLIINDWVLERAADIGQFLLCERRDNPPGPGSTRKYERAIERLEEVRAGRLHIPRCPMRRASAPVTSGVRIRLDPYPRTVVELYRSTGIAEGYSRHRDTLEWMPIDYNI